MKTGANGVGLIKRSEGLRLTAYRCPAGVWTIGYGHTSRAGPPQVFPGMTITQDQADAILAADLEKFEADVGRHVTVAVAQCQFDALVSFVFNVGAGNFRASTLLRKLNAGDKDAVPAELLKWDKAHDRSGQLVRVPGLTTRRHLEASLWAGAKFVEGGIPKKVAPPKKKPRIGTHVAAGGAGVAAGGTAASTISVSCSQLGSDLHRAIDLRLLIPIGLAFLAVLAKYLWDSHFAPGTRLHQSQ